MRERSRRRAARVDFSSLVAPEEAAEFDSGSEFEGNDNGETDVDAGLDDNMIDDVDLDVDSPELDSDSTHNGKDSKEEVNDTSLAPSSQRRVSRAALRSQAQGTARVENLRDRLILFYGDSNAELVRAIRLRHKWSDNLFVAAHSQLEYIAQSARSKSPFSSALKRVQSKFIVSGASIAIDGIRLDPSMQRVSETAGILNAGYGVSKLCWDSTGSLLAIGLLCDAADPLNSSSLRTSLAPKSDLGAGRTLIHVYKAEGSRLTPYASIEGLYGPVVDMCWSPCSFVAAVFANGSFGIFEVLATGAFELKLHDVPLVGSTAKATCICWRMSNVVVGYADGLVAEFDVSGGPVPSYVVQLHDSVVTSVASASPNLPDYIFSTGVDGHSKVTSTRDLRLIKKAPRLKHFAATSTYMPMADSFVGHEDANTAKLVPVRNPTVQLTLTSVSRHKAAVTALAASASHPLLLSGSQDGSVHITNPLRRTMATRRKRDIHLDCTIWRLECSHRTSEFRFVEVLSVNSLTTKRESLNSLPIYPASIAITGIAWQPNSTWYAAATAGGIVRLENVDG